MADAENRGGGKAESLPPGVGTEVPVKLRDGSTVVVRRWGFTKSLLVMKLLEGVWSELLAIKIEKAKVDVESVKRKIFDLLGPSAIDLVRMSLDERDRMKFQGPDPDFEDVLDVLNAVLDVNVTEALVKKVTALMRKGGQLFA